LFWIVHTDALAGHLPQSKRATLSSETLDLELYAIRGAGGALTGVAVAFRPVTDASGRRRGVEREARTRRYTQRI
jgi:hypothetical protein